MRGAESNESIDLLRGGDVVTSFAGAHGRGLREVRLTAMLGYLIAAAPERFCRLFGFQGEATSVRLEMRHGEDRSDILVETSGGLGLVEAKVHSVDPSRQAMRYSAKWRVLLTEFRPTQRQRRDRRFRYLRWRDLTPILEALAKRNETRVRFIAADLMRYLQEHRLMPQRNPLEVYARELNDPKTIELFLKAHIYFCNYEKGSRLAEARYFAPHFGMRSERQMPGIRHGISHIAKIERVELASVWPDVESTIRELWGKTRLTQVRAYLKPIRSGWSWSGKEARSMLLLGAPRLAFNPPILKDNLQEGSGWLSKRFLTFDELYAAWGS